MTHKNNSFMRLCAGLACLVLSLSACNNDVIARGHVEDTEAAGAIKVNESTREDVLNLLGSPSSVSSFGEETWYYITSIKEHQAFLQPVLVKQDLLSVRFSADGHVASVEHKNEKDQRDVDFVDRETPTEGHELSFIEQTLGNIGRYNKAGGGSALGQPKRPPGGL